MRSRRSIWIVPGLLVLMAGGWLLWSHAHRVKVNHFAPPFAGAFHPASTAPQLFHAGPASGSILSALASSTAARTNPFAYRLSNTEKSIGELENDHHAILLENALIDTRAKLDFSIPKNLESQGDPGAYMVQANGPISAAFRAMLAAAGAQIISYIPNDAYLVRIPAGGANMLAANPLTQSVIPYQPYYKVQSPLLAFDQKLLPAGAVLNLGLFADNSAATIQQIQKLGGTVLSQDSEPFGPEVRVQPPANWTALAQLPGVLIVEASHSRKPANDLSRVTTGVSINTTNNLNYLNLSGSNVVVEFNDTGIDKNHPDFTPGRVIGDSAGSLVDTNGHGTFIAGEIAGSGLESTTVTNALGSINPGVVGQYRGKAPLATLYSVGGIDGGSDTNVISDRYFQETPALTNALISNNSWGYDGDTFYDLAAASYDAAVRDALSEVTGSQPVLFVFAAGNDGYIGNNGANGDDDGGGGTPDTISSPGTAKDVITVGALEQLRNITAIVTNADGTTSKPWLKMTDTSYQVAGYSSRGNVGIGTEGTYGRFKPDVVSPGTFVLSTRSSEWDTNSYYNPTNDHNTTLTDVVSSGSFTDPPLEFFVYNNAVNVTIQATPETGTNALPIYVWLGTDPNTTPPVLEGTNFVSLPAFPANTDWYCAISNTSTAQLIYTLTVDVQTTNDLGDYYQVLDNLNETLGTQPEYYRYESGTSMAAADVSGVLALMQDYFTNTLQTTPSPALLKAMLINGARATGNYNFQVQNMINFEGWGLINLPDSLPLGITNQAGVTCSTFFLDQSPTNALATGDSQTFNVSVSPVAAALPLRVTLAWTDPPGNPAAAIKLVNNLDLVVSNTATGDVYFGNDIPAGGTVNSVWDTNSPPNLDAINNVENVFLPDSSGSNYVIYVIGRDVNVNVVTAQTNTYAININPSGAFAPNVVQDFALVVSCGEGEVPNAITVTNNGVVSNPTGDQQITYVTSTNTPLMNQMVGASSPLLGTNTISVGTNSQWNPNGAITLGMTNQWHFYVVTNTLGYTNAAFVTFSPNTLSIPREGVFVASDANSTRPEADIDLYVAGPNDPNASSLTNLDPNVISNCVNGVNGDGASLSSSGTEFVAYDDSVSNNVYYICVKSEDQMAAEYDFLPVFSLLPFSQKDNNGNEIVNGVPLPASVPDGDNAHPGVVSVLALALDPTIVVGTVIVTNIVYADNYGDIVGTLTHPGSSGLTVLNNHDSPDPSGTNSAVYDDSGQNTITGSQPSDGPGSLQSFDDQQALGAWFLSEVDDAPSQGAAVLGFTLLIKPHQPLQNGTTNSLAPGQSFNDYIDVPAGATNLTVSLTNYTAPPQPLQLFIKFGSQPTTNVYDKMITINSGTPLWNGSLTVGLTDVPPLQPGRYYITVFNPLYNTASQTFSLFATILPVNPIGTPVDFGSSGLVPLLDDAVTVSNSSNIFMTNTQPIVSVNVGIRVDHPRISDLVFHLISPDGTRILLMENRGGDTTNGAGATVVVTNIVNVSAGGNGLANTNYINTGALQGTFPITYNFFTAPDQMTVYYGTNSANFNTNSPYCITNTGFINNPPLGPGSQNTQPETINVSFPPSGIPANSTYLTVIMNQFGNPAGPNGTAWTYTFGGVQTNYLYLTFTDDTNLTTTPIKFAIPPFVPTNTTYGITWTDSFETYPSGIYTNGTTFVGWTVLTNQVAIITNPPAYDGTNLLSVMDGAVSNTLPTAAGQKYLLQYSQGKLPFTGFIVANDNNGPVSEFDLNGNGTNYNTTLVQPYSVTFDNSGNLYVADDSDNTIYKFTPPGTNGVVFATAASGLYQPQGLACDSSGNLYVANEGDGTIYKFTPGGAGTFFANTGHGNFSAPDALAFDENGNLYVANYLDDVANDGSGSGTIEEFTNANPNTFAYFATVANGLENPSGLAFDNTGTNLYVANFNGFTTPAAGNPVLKFSPPSTNVTVIAYLNEPTALAIDNNSNLYVTDIGAQAIYKIANGTQVVGKPPFFATNDANGYLNSPEGLAFYTANNSDETNSANWQSQSQTFTASQANMPLVLDASGGGFATSGSSAVTNAFSDNTVFDDFTLTSIPTDLYYQPEQSLSSLAGISAAGQWQLEIQDDRTGATNSAALVSWELQFIFGNTNAELGRLYGGAGQTNFIGAGGIAWYQITVPAVANYSTNRLKFSSAPVNVWFDTNNPPTTNILFLQNSTSGSVLLSTASASPLEPTPNIVPDETYYLGVQNTNSFTIHYAIEVDFDAGNAAVPSNLRFTSAVRKASSIGLKWTAALGAQVEVQWSDSLTSPMRWNTITNPAATTSDGVSTFTDNGSQTAPLGAHRYYRLVQLPPGFHTRLR